MKVLPGHIKYIDSRVLDSENLLLKTSRKVIKGKRHIASSFRNSLGR